MSKHEHLQLWLYTFLSLFWLVLVFFNGMLVWFENGGFIWSSDNAVALLESANILFSSPPPPPLCKANFEWFCEHVFYTIWTVGCNTWKCYDTYSDLPRHTPWACVRRLERASDASSVCHTPRHFFTHSHASDLLFCLTLFFFCFCTLNKIKCFKNMNFASLILI